MNLKTLRDQVRRKLKISSTTTLANSAIDEQLNVIYLKLAADLAEINQDFFEEQKAKFDLVQNSSLYSQPTDCMKVKQIRLAYSAPTDESDYKVATFYDPILVENIQAEEEDISTSNPIVDVTNNYFRIKPTPESDVANGGEIYYIARPSALTLSSDVPVIPKEYHDLIADGATTEIASWFEMWNKYREFLAKFERRREEMLKELTSRNIGREERFINPLEKQRTKTTTELWD